MKRQDIIFEFKKKIMKVEDEHLLKYFFDGKYFSLHPLLSSLCLSLGNVNEVNPGYADEMIRRLVALKGKKEETLEDILSVFSEILIANHAVSIADSIDGKKYFLNEPGLKQKKKNPEFRSVYNGKYYCAEVKKPKLISYRKTRKRPFQLPARMPSDLSLGSKEETTLPRDNPIKDFLISAQAKFEAYREEYSDDYRLLFIMWDDFMYEPISALKHPFQGLLTKNSFYKDSEGFAVEFPLIDGIVIVKHLHNFENALLEFPLNDDIRHVFQYEKQYPLHAFIQNPSGRKVPGEFLEAFDCMEEDAFNLFADYAITDFVFWI
ncbi:hypothetical protein ACIQZI_13270 [Peribacillus sp. NPDC096379]|uniref:hypothetical protein n=1 Tax=Peribacillus sp. NPDC096379 TaxID=3364393 RepID=UPI00381A2F76